jgi:hypothetical protein
MKLGLKRKKVAYQQRMLCSAMCISNLLSLKRTALPGFACIILAFQ